MISLLYVGENITVGLVLALFLKLLEAPVGTFLGGGCEENLVFCVLKHIGADVAAVHDYAFS